jgi:hypothetical protein
MKTNFEMYVHVDLGVTPALVALVNAIMGQRQMPVVQQPSASEQPEETPETVAEPEPPAEMPEDPTVLEPEPEPVPVAVAVAVEEPRELTEEDIRDAMHRTRQRIEGENYKEETDSELYKKYHRQLTSVFKNIASLLGADKPSALPAEQRAAFIAECDELEVREGTIQPRLPF